MLAKVRHFDLLNEFKNMQFFHLTICMAVKFGQRNSDQSEKNDCNLPKMQRFKAHNDPLFIIIN